MRRGHPSAGGWRNDNHRGFRPRTGGHSQFRPSRGYLLESGPRFPSPGTRGNHRPPHHGGAGQRDMERDSYHIGHSRPQNQRQILPYLHQIRQNSTNQNLSFKQVETNFHINKMGDVDFRNKPKESQTTQRPSPWVVPPYEMRQQSQIYERRPFRRDSFEHNRLPPSEFGGHRPHSSDYYGNNTAPDIDKSNSFSHSIDDTVDIIRKRLQNRNEPQQDSEQTHRTETYTRESDQESLKNDQHPQLEGSQIRKRIQRQKSDVKVSCDKMKNKIVHQLFKMDKDKIHKLMDNPNSSSKFEFAISSLITESQNSFNRHMRSVAEKSLCSSSSEFIHNDNNTVYEDTFMKQMQCILDPQDTVLLEDIKPLVMAEINNLLQLDEYDHRLEIPEFAPYDNADRQQNYDHTDSVNEYTSDHYDYQPYPESEYGCDEDNKLQNRTISENYVQPESPPDSKPLFDSSQWEDDKPEYTANQSKPRRSIDQINENKRPPTPLPLFQSSTEQFSDDDDPFAELDNQYHVAVDHNFIEAHYNSPQQTPCNRNECHSPNTIHIESSHEPSVVPEIPEEAIKQELDVQLKEFVTSPLKLSQNSKSQARSPKPQENIDNIIEDYVNVKKENILETKANESASTSSKTSLQPHSRKRVTDEKPSHRKEKRKKSDSNGKDSSKQILNKNIIINVNDCAAKATEKCESGKSIFNLFFSKDQSNSKDTPRDKKCESTKEYSNKYVKRKENIKKNKSIDGKKKPNLNTSSHSIVSPTVSSDSGHTPTKTDPKTKLKTFDIFEQQPRKSNVLHQPLRNTAPAPSITPKKGSIIEPKKIEGISNRKSRRHIAVQATTKVTSMGSQTISPRFIKKATQTSPLPNSKEVSRSTDALERMKEIDIEIQHLLQEKFKLYSSLECKTKETATMQTLGMTVLNVTPMPDDDSLNKHSIVDDFTNIPVEELEQIALESIQEAIPQGIKKDKRCRTYSKDRNKSKSPVALYRNKSKKVTTPNVSLIEQIISDDRPLEEIVPLKELETPPRYRKTYPPKKKTVGNKKTRLIDKIITKVDTLSPLQIKECRVILIREDLDKLLEKQLKKHEKHHNEKRSVLTPVSDEKHCITPVKVKLPVQKVEETVNDVQIDMLDVSEDIVIGDEVHGEVKDDKVIDRIDLSVSEEIILDNSQSSMEECVASQSTELCKIYDYSADENLRRDCTIVTGNADAVLAIECIEKDFIAACLDGNVYHFGGDGQLLNTLRGSNLAVTCLTIVKEKYGTTVYTGSLDSRIRYYDLETGLEKGPECNVLSPIQTMDRAWDTIFVGTRTGFVLQFECKNNMLIPVSTIKFSEQAILALRALKEGPRKVLLVAARSENVTIKDAVTGLLLRTLEGPKMTIYTLLFEDGKVYCGTSSHQIHVFDYASGSHMLCHGGGKGAVVLRAAGGLVFAGCYDGGVYVFRHNQPEPRAVLRGPKLMLLSLAVRHTEIIAGYKDRSLYIWKIPLAILQELVL